MKATQIFWKEPNRAKSPPLHIASSGERYSTLTGVFWIDEYRLIVNHRDGLRIALFDTRLGTEPVATTAIPHLSDDIAAKQIDENLWEVVVSGCWNVIYSKYHLKIEKEIKFQIISTYYHTDKTFCHGVAYGKNGDLCLAFHTGENPRIQIGNKTWILPRPWGARDVTYDSVNDKYYVIAVSANPQLESYNKTNTTIWVYDSKSDIWKINNLIEDMHSDSCQVYHGKLWFPDQKGDRVLGLCLNKEKPTLFVNGACFDFPHGLGISSKGLLAVTNYGDSSIALFDVSKF
jgi:hypothetical protein